MVVVFKKTIMWKNIKNFFKRTFNLLKKEIPKIENTPIISNKTGGVIVNYRKIANYRH
jgi:hypothetical protein